MRNFSDRICGKIKIYFFFSRTFFFKSYLLWDDVEKYCTAGQTKDDNMAHAHCMLDTQGLKHILGMCYIYSSTATMVPKTHASVTLCLHCLSYYFIIHKYGYIFQLLVILRPLKTHKIWNYNNSNTNFGRSTAIFIHFSNLRMTTSGWNT